MKIIAYGMAKGQDEWRCTVTFLVTTAKQFTDEVHDATRYAPGPWRALLRARWEAWRTTRSLRAQPGEREAKGWVS